MILKIISNRYFQLSLLICLILILLNRVNKLNIENKRVLNNYSILEDQKNLSDTNNLSKIRSLNLKYEEASKYYFEEKDSLLKQLSIKPKNIISYQYIEINKKDTIKTIIEISDSSTRIAKGNIGCSSVEFEWSINDTLGVFRGDIITKLNIIEHTERKKLFNKKWLPKWGRKEVFITVEDECSNNKDIIKNYKLDIWKKNE